MTRELRELAESVAREAGRQLREAFAGPLVNVTAKSSPTDLVSEADHAAERLIRERLAAARPGRRHPRRGGRRREGDAAALRWVVDPLDGTINFLFGIPQWAVSIACEDEQGTLVGVVYDPMRDELWSRRARRRRRCSTAARSTASDRSRPRDRDGRHRLRLRRRGAPRCRPRSSRRLLPAGARHPPARLGRARPRVDRGGRLDAFYERGLNAWDLAAGALLCRARGPRGARAAADAAGRRRRAGCAASAGDCARCCSN